MGTGRAGGRPGTVVAVVLGMAGLLFVASAGTAQGTNLRTETEDLAALVAAEERRVDGVEGRVAGLQDEAAALGEQVGAEDVVTVAAAAEAEILAPFAGMTEASGPGLVVTLDDAPDDPALRARVANPDDLLVHQQDLQAVVNALWLGGAEGIMLMDQRVISTSAVRCVGNTLSLHGRPYSPPYTVTALGDPAALRAALDAAPLVTRYREYVDAYGLGYQVADSDGLTLPAYAGPRTLEHARVAAARP